LPRLDGNPHLIVGAKEGAALVNLEKPWRAIRGAAGLDDVRLHDLRHTFASVAASSGMGLPIIGKILGHTQPATTAPRFPVDQVAEHLRGYGMPYLRDWEPLAEALQRVIAAGANEQQARLDLCQAMADRKIPVRVRIDDRHRDVPSDRTLLGGQIGVPPHLTPGISIGCGPARRAPGRPTQPRL